MRRLLRVAVAVALLAACAVVAVDGQARIRVRRPAATGGGGGSPSGDCSLTGPDVVTAGYLTMGLACPSGAVPSGYAVQVGSFTTQTDVKNAWPDGSLKFAIVSANATSTGTKALSVISAPGGSYTPTWPTTTLTFTPRANTDWPIMHGVVEGTTGTTRYYRISSINGSSKESFATPSMGFSAASSLDGSNYVKLQGATPPSTASIRVYRGTSRGGEQLLATQAVTTKSVTTATYVDGNGQVLITTSAAHGLVVGDAVWIDGATSLTGMNGPHQVTAVNSATVFQFYIDPVAGTPDNTNATGTITAYYATYNDTGGSTTATSPKANATDDPGTVYTATLGSFSGTDTWLNGAVVREARKRVTPVDGSSNPYGAGLAVLFDVRSYADGGTRIDFTVDNTADVAGMDKAGPYDIALVVNGSTLFSDTQVTSYSFTRWHKRVWVGSDVDAEITPDFEPFFQAKVLPRIDTDITERTDYDLTADNYKAWRGGGDESGAYKIGEMAAAMADGGGRAELNFVSEWEAVYLVYPSQHNRQVVLANGDLAGFWSFHYSTASGTYPQLGVDYDDQWYPVGSNPAMRPLAGVSYARSGPRGAREGYWSGFNAGGSPVTGPDTRSDSSAWGKSAILEAIGMEHVPSIVLTPYLLTGDRFYVDEGKFWANAAVMHNTPAWVLTDNNNFPGWRRGRDGATGNERLVSGSGMGREFAWPLRALVAGAVMTPDADADRAYLVEGVQNNLDYVSDYHDMMIAAGSTVYGGALAHESNAAQGVDVARTMSVTGASNAASSVITTSGDHHFSTGDYVTLSNGTQYQITVLSSTTFSVPANVSGAGITTAYKRTGMYEPLWRTGYSVYVVDWALRQGIWTDKGSAQAWVDAYCALLIMLNVDDPNFTTSSSGDFGWSPVIYDLDGKYITEWHDTYAKMAHNLSTSSVYYLSGSTPGFSYHWNNNSVDVHQIERYVFYLIGKRRGLANAQSAITRAGLITNYLSTRLGTADVRGVAVHFGSELD